MLAAVCQLGYLYTFQQAQTLALKHAAAAATLDEQIQGLPQNTGFRDLWRNTDGDLFLSFDDGTDESVIDAWQAAVKHHCPKLTTEHEVGWPGGGSEGHRDDWVKIATINREWPYRVKEAYSQALRNLGELGGYLPGGWADHFGGPRPLTGMLASGLLGAGAGYGLGWLGEQALPRTWRRGRLRNSLAIMGGLAGAAPGAAMMAENLRSGRDWNSSALLGYPNTSEGLHYAPKLEDGSANPAYDPNIPGVPLDYKQATLDAPGEVPAHIKEAFSRTGFELEPVPLIPIDAFNHSLYNDPYVASRLDPPTQAATSGLLEAAYQNRGGGPRVITPADIAAVSVGMGSGYLSGAIVGKALGALVGLPTVAQDRLRQTGLWAGLIANVVPLAFGAR